MLLNTKSKTEQRKQIQKKKTTNITDGALEGYIRDTKNKLCTCKHKPLVTALDKTICKTEKYVPVSLG